MTPTGEAHHISHFLLVPSPYLAREHRTTTFRSGELNYYRAVMCRDAGANDSTRRCWASRKRCEFADRYFPRPDFCIAAAPVFLLGDHFRSRCFSRRHQRHFASRMTPYSAAPMNSASTTAPITAAPSSHRIDIRFSPSRSYHNVGLRGKYLRLCFACCGGVSCVQYRGDRAQRPPKPSGRLAGIPTKWSARCFQTSPARYGRRTQPRTSPLRLAAACELPNDISAVSASGPEMPSPLSLPKFSGVMRCGT